MRVNSWLFRTLEVYGTPVHHPGQWRAHAKLRRLLRANVDQELTVTRAGSRRQLNPADYTQREFFWLSEKDRGRVPPEATGSSRRSDPRHRRKLRFRRPDFCPGAGPLHPGHRLRAFSQHLPTAERQHRAHGLEDVIQAHPLALSDREGRARMWSRPDNAGARGCSTRARSRFRHHARRLQPRHGSTGWP
jgi:hypothetical protein